MASDFHGAHRRFWKFGMLLAAILATSCSVSTRVTWTQRSSVEQLLLVRSLERALAGIDIERFEGKSMAVDVYGLTADRDFARELMLAHFRKGGVRVSGSPDRADLHLKIFVSALGVDRGEALVGIPAFAAPVVNLPVPEIAFFKRVRSRGRAEIQVFAFEQDSGDFVVKSPAAVGEARYDDYTVLILINFNLNDLDEPLEEETDAGP